jgi:antitoxin CptB
MMTKTTVETTQARLKRMAMRSWRRGTKEMDLILGPYADAHLSQMQEAELRLYDRLLEENDTDLFPMILGQQSPPEELGEMIAKIGQFARQRLQRA